ncbi:hypothetical protein [Martelella mediterranea]|uniref:Uncharacterized protein n=1 Tax=Martelella mediterranea TaxID=293089 RepID=A0A4R3P0W4_9HYPH|nr:hypothetical protein [Martelella mediterranea]TCT39589.1 hypothetical protein EDC90_101287 [Martelella mediterranea]
MQTLIYEGKIEPEAAPLTLDYRPKFLRQETQSTPEVEYEVIVFVGRIRVRVTTSVVNEEIASDLFLVAWDVARTFVETAGFVKGIPYSVNLDRVILPNGEVRAYVLGDRSLAAMHDFTDDDLEALSDISLVDLKCGLVLSDILMTLGKAHYSPTACGRVADSLARLISPNVNRTEQWKNLRRTLRVDEAYVRSLSDVSKASRHGDRTEVDAATNQKTAGRAWSLVGRYLRYRLNGELDPEVYPLLEG